MSKTNPSTAQRSQIASLMQQLVQGSRELHLLPDGEFAPVDGRPMPWGTWKLNAEIAQRVIDKAKARPNKFVIDYEHQTQMAEKNGQPAPAAGWWKDMEYRPGKGLYAVNVAWTPPGEKFIENGEYLYQSAVFEFDDKTGEVLSMHCAALTNTPALHGLDAVRLAALRSHFEKADATPADNLPGGNPSSTQTQTENDMNPVLKALLLALGLEDAATEAQANAAMASLKARAGEADGLKNQVAMLKSTPPDPAKFVPLDRFTEINTELATLKAAQSNASVEELITEAKQAGKCTSQAAEQVWREVGKSSLAQLKALVDSTPGNPALAGKQQTQGKDLNKADPNAPLTTEQLAMCKNMGLDPVFFRKTLATAA